MSTNWRGKSVASWYFSARVWEPVGLAAPRKQPKIGNQLGTAAAFSKYACNTASRTKTMRRVRRNTMAKSEANARQRWQTTSTYIKLNQITISQSKCVVFKIRDSLRPQIFFPTQFVRQRNEHWEAQWTHWTLLVKIMKLRTEKACSCGSLVYQQLVWACVKKWQNELCQCLCTFVVVGIQHVVFAAQPKSICTWDFSVWMFCPVYLNVLALISPYGGCVHSLSHTVEQLFCKVCVSRFWQASLCERQALSS